MRTAPDEARAARWWPRDTDRREMLVARAVGATFPEIAAERGVTRQCVQQQIRAAERKYGVTASPAVHAAPQLPAAAPPRLLLLFFERHTIDQETGCWEWTGGRAPGGQGMMPSGRGGATLYARRFAYTTFIGPIPPACWVSGTCRNPGCVNPDHLFAAPRAEVMARTRDRKPAAR